MSRKKSDQPTDAELTILRILWERGPSTVKEVHDALAGTTGYTTVLKLLQIMLEKGRVKREEERRPHIYRATKPKAQTQTQFVQGLIGKLFEGSAAQLAMHALEKSPVSPEELQEIRELIDRLEEEGKA